ncbi:MAG: hypothetical protein ACKO2V_16175 [Snowella sp.]
MSSSWDFWAECILPLRIWVKIYGLSIASLYSKMRYDPNIHHRRSIRLKNHSYTEIGAYFITICTYQKQRLFGNIKNGKMQLNSLGAIATHSWQEIPNHFSHIQLDVFVIMPNHIHGIL